MNIPQAIPTRLFSVCARARSLFLHLFIGILFACVAARVASAQTFTTWSGGTSTAWDWSTGGNWVGGAAPANNLTSNIAYFNTAFTNQPSITMSGSIAGIAEGTSLGQNLVIGTGNSSYILSLGASGISALSTSKSVTINANVDIAAAQNWTTTANNAATIIVNGNLTDSNNITITGGQNSSGNSVAAVSYQLNGSNSSFTGNIYFSTNANDGVLLGSAASMIGGEIDLNHTASENIQLWLTSNSASTPYDFSIAGTTGPGTGTVSFRGAGNGGLFLTGGNVYWDPGFNGTSSSNYNWNGITNTTIDFAGSNNTNPDTVELGNSSEEFIVSGANKTFRGGGGSGGSNNPGYVTLLSALADGGGSTQYSLSTSLNLLTLTQASVNSAHPLNFNITGGAVSITNANQLPTGNVNVSGGVLILNGVSWDTFANSFAAGTANGDIQFTGGGIAARGTGITVDSNSTSSTTFAGSTLYLGANALDSSGNLYANASVTITQAINYSSAGTSAQTINASSGNSSLSTGGIYTLNSTPILYTLSGLLTGKSSNGTTITLSGNENSTASNIPVVVLSNASNSNLNIIAGPSSATNPGNYGILIASSDGALGGGTLTDYSGTPGGKSAGWLILYQGSQTSTKNITFNGNGKDETLAPWGIGAYSGNVVYTGVSTFTDSITDAAVLTPLNWDAESGATFALGVNGGTAATFTNNSSQTTTSTLVFQKTGAGTAILDNVAYNGSAVGASSYQFNIENGALQETGNNSSNSTSGAYITLTGGVLETNNTNQGGSFSRTLSITAGSGNINMTNGGGFSAYGGALTVNLNSGAALSWSASGFINAANNGALVFGSQTANNVVTFQNAINLAPSGSGTERTIEVIGTGLSNEAVLSGNLTTAASGNTVGINKTGSGVLDLTGANNLYYGDTTVSAGTLEFGAPGSLYNNVYATYWNGTYINVASGATLALALGGSGFTAANVHTLFTGGIFNASSATTGLQAGSAIGFDTTNGSFTQGSTIGAIANSTGADGGAIGVTKLGANVLELDQSNTYTGPTTVTQGTLIVSGAISGAANVTGGTLGGGGTIAGATTVSSGATLYPGATGVSGVATTTAQTLTLQSTVTLSTGSIFEANLNDGSGHSDLLAITGSLSIASGDTLTLNILNALTASSYEIASFTGSETGAFTTVTGVPSGYQVEYNAHDIELDAVAIPEPGTWAAMLSGFGLLIIAQKARSRSRRVL